ncbi:O-acetyl-ADP-ribose deacetylase [Nitrospira sp. Nam74]
MSGARQQSGQAWWYFMDGGQLQKNEPRFLNGRVRLLTGDLTTQAVDAIVNAANPTLLGGGGVDRAIHRAGGPEILAACQELRQTSYPHGLRTGEAVITPAGRLPARHVIHTVGPVKGTNHHHDAQLLAACYQNCLALAVQHGLVSIAFPSISTGAYGYPKAEAAEVASRAISTFLDADVSLTEVRLVFFSDADRHEFLRAHVFPC